MPTISEQLAIAVQNHQAGQLSAAEQIYRDILNTDPSHADALHLLGVIAHQCGHHAAAVEYISRAIQQNGNSADFHSNLGAVYRVLKRIPEAIACYRRALELNPQSANAHNNLGVVALKSQAKVDEAIACFQRAVELKPDFSDAHGNLIYAQLFSPAFDGLSLLEEHRRWNKRHAVPLAKFIHPHVNDRSPDRRLRIGYVSPDLRDHVIGRNVLPLFREHDHKRFEIFSYSDARFHDEFTKRFQGYSDTWRDTVSLSDDQLARQIRDDGIDILVDLTLHMANNRLLVFARKPAPVQVTFAGYPGTTGLTTIDYRLTDPYLDPPGLNDHFYSEKSIRLPDTFWCYDPFDADPAVNALPASKNGQITFGCLNNFCKVNRTVLKIWALVLGAVEGSRIVILNEEGDHRQQTLDIFSDEGIASDRVTFVPNQPRANYLRQYHGIDIGLDTIPYNGHTTSLDSFWMGVPVVTLVGSTVVGRAGLCQLMNLGLPDLIAHSPDQFVSIAAGLARDRSRLTELRATLRDRMRASPLMDASRFARNIETAYREMWHRWCVDNEMERR